MVSKGRDSTPCTHHRNHPGGQLGTKIVLCLLPRLQHWQHDMAIHSQYCISLAFCEKVAANLSPQSARLSMWRGRQPRYEMKSAVLLPRASAAPPPYPPNATPPPSSSSTPSRPPSPPPSLSKCSPSLLATTCSPSRLIRACALPAPANVCWVKSGLFLCTPMCHFSILQVWGSLKWRVGLNGNRMAVTIKL